MKLKEQGHSLCKTAKAVGVSRELTETTETTAVLALSKQFEAMLQRDEEE